MEDDGGEPNRRYYCTSITENDEYMRINSVSRLIDYVKARQSTERVDGRLRPRYISMVWDTEFRDAKLYISHTTDESHTPVLPVYVVYTTDNKTVKKEVSMDVLDNIYAIHGIANE